MRKIYGRVLRLACSGNIHRSQIERQERPQARRARDQRRERVMERIEWETKEVKETSIKFLPQSRQIDILT